MEIHITTTRESFFIKATGEHEKALIAIRRELDSDSPFAMLSNAFVLKSDILKIVVKK